jgi:hypothetical protein
MSPKVLPPSFAGDLDWLRRVSSRKPARPRRSTIPTFSRYDVGDYDGGPISSRGCSPERRCVRRLLKARPVSKAVGIARQIASGLAAAQGHHPPRHQTRESLRLDGRVKILDLGLAKLREGRRPP